MAESTYATEYGGVLQIPCIIDEGAPTVTARTYGPGGTFEVGHTWATELRKNDVISLSGETSNTYETCKGMPVVETVTNADDKVFGMIISEPRLVVTPPSTAATNTLQERLDGQYYRVATVEIWGGITAIRTAHLLTADAVAIVPGVETTLDVDVSQSNTDHDLVLNDVASGGVGFMPLHYVAKTTAGTSYTILVGMTALGTAAT